MFEHFFPPDSYTPYPVPDEKGFTGMFNPHYHSAVKIRKSLVTMADEFVSMIPDAQFSTAEIQGFLLNHKWDPEGALRQIPVLVEQKEEENKLKEAESDRKKEEYEKQMKETMHKQMDWNQEWKDKRQKKKQQMDKTIRDAVAAEPAKWSDAFSWLFAGEPLEESGEDDDAASAEKNQDVNSMASYKSELASNIKMTPPVDRM